MGKTITEKILSRAVGKDVTPGEYIEVSSRLPFTAGNLVRRGADQMEAISATKLFDPKMIRMVEGHFGSTSAYHLGEERVKGRQWAKKMGIPQENIYDLGRSGSGVEHVVAGDRAWALPGELFFQAVNGHTTTLGALGSFAVTMSYGSGAYMITGKTWLRVPQSVRVVVNGTLQPGVIGRDVSEFILGEIGPSAAVGKVMEWTGPVIDQLSIDGRFSICCNALFFGAWTAIMNPDAKTIEYVRSHNTESFEPLVSDADAKYAKVYEFDVSNLAPQIVPPPERYHVHPVSQYEGTPINRGFVGTCDNGRMEDMRMVAEVLKGRKVHPSVMFNITPATVDIFRQCVQEGLMEIFLAAEAGVHHPNCGQCYGANTPLGTGDVCVASSTCNYPGRMGSKAAEIYLANPATVAASCIEAKITDPRKYF